MWSVIFTAVYEGNLVSDRWKREQYFSGYFLDHCEYPSFILPQTLKSADFLKINCHIESETMFMNFFVICYINLSILWMYFYASVLYHNLLLRIYWLILLCRSSKCTVESPTVYSWENELLKGNNAPAFLQKLGTS